MLVVPPLPVVPAAPVVPASPVVPPLDVAPPVPSPRHHRAAVRRGAAVPGDSPAASATFAVGRRPVVGATGPEAHQRREHQRHLPHRPGMSARGFG
jgi:hypothetical protein